MLSTPTRGLKPAAIKRRSMGDEEPLSGQPLTESRADQLTTACWSAVGDSGVSVPTDGLKLKDFDSLIAIISGPLERWE